MKFIVILLGFCCFHQASGEIHTLQYFYTVTSGISNFPEFVDVGMVDGVPISRYDSNTQRKVPLQKWMEENFDQQYWDSTTANMRGLEQSFKANIQIVKERFNQTGGVHVFQEMYGCEWNDVTTAKKGFRMNSYDGEDFVSLDLDNMVTVASVPQALPTKRKWDMNKGFLEGRKQYLTQICIDWLRKYVQYGSSTLGRKVPPEVSLFQRGEGSAVVCHATGFYPDGVMITWKKDGEEMTDDVDVGETLSNADGNFQKRAVLTVPLEQRKTSQYVCEVTHSSGEPIIKILNEDELRTKPDSVPFGPIIGVVVGLLVVIAVIAGFVVLRNKKKAGPRFVPANTDESSQSSSEKARIETYG